MRSWVQTDEQRDVKDVWELRSVNGHAEEADVQKAYGDHSTNSANSRPAMRSWVNLNNEIWVDNLVQTDYPEPQMGEVCGGANGSKMQDCRVSRWHDQNQICSGKAGERPGHNCLDRAEGKNAGGALAQYPEPQMGAVCGGANGSKMQDCRVSRWHDQNQICSGKAGERPGHNCLDRAEGKNASGGAPNLSGPPTGAKLQIEE